MRRRDFAIGLALTAAARRARAQEPAKQHRIAIVIAVGAVARIDDPKRCTWQAFWEELRRLGDVEDKTSLSSGIPARIGADANESGISARTDGGLTKVERNLSG